MSKEVRGFKWRATDEQRRRHEELCAKGEYVRLGDPFAGDEKAQALRKSLEGKIYTKEETSAILDEMARRLNET